METYDRAKQKRELDALVEQLEATGAIHHAWSVHEYDNMPKPVEVQFADGATGYCTIHTYGGQNVDQTAR